MPLTPKTNITFTAELTVSIHDDTIFVRVGDKNAAIEFLELTVDPTIFVQALGTRAHVPCVAEVRGLDRIGKKQEHRTLEFPLPKKCYRDKELAREEVYKYLPGEEWKPDLEFSSQGSFFEKDGEYWARTIIRRWVPKPKLKERLKKVKKAKQKDV